MTTTKTVTIFLTPETVERVLADFLYQGNAFPEGRDILWIDHGIPINDEGFIEFDVEYVEYEVPPHEDDLPW